MAERIKKIPLKEVLTSLDTAWDDAGQRLNIMPTSEVFDRMPGAVYYNASHPFRDKLHLEGMIEGIRFALTGDSPVVEYWLKRAAAIQAGSVERPTQQILTPPSKLQIILIGLTHGLGLKDAWGIFRSKPVRN